MEEMSVVEQILDEDNESPVELFDDKGKSILFDQIAVIPFNNRLYAILKPITKIEGVGDDEALVFEIFIEEDTVVIVNDFDLIDSVFAVYYDLLHKQIAS